MDIRLFSLFFLTLALNQSLTAEPPRKYLCKEVIVLDAGHGGDDRGTCSTQKPILIEKRLTLFTTFLVRSTLEGLGYQTLMTRLKDETISLNDRVAFSNGVNPSCFVSIHFNSAPRKEAQGIEIFLYKEGGSNPRIASSEKLADSILRRMIEWTGAENRGVKGGPFRVIKETTSPAVLIECGFLTNGEELKNISQTAYLKRLAIGIAKGIDDYLTAKRVPTRSTSSKKS